MSLADTALLAAVVLGLLVGGWLLAQRLQRRCARRRLRALRAAGAACHHAAMLLPAEDHLVVNSLIATRDVALAAAERIAATLAPRRPQKELAR
jgi:hypothetical protein